jgi:DNA modification methylase
MDLSADDHLILARIAARRVRKEKKDRAFCRLIGRDWIAFCADKPKGDPRIKTAAKQYDLDPDSLRRHARVAQNWDELSDADEWGIRSGFVNAYEHEPQMSLALLDAFRNDAKAATDRPETDAIRSEQTASSGSKIDILHGDALELLRNQPDRHFNCCITSPPYWRVRDWGPGAIGMEPTLTDYLAAVVAVFHELRRVMRDDGVVWIVIGDRYASRARAESSGHGRFLYHPIPAAEADIIPLGNRLLIPQRLAIALQDDGWIIRSIIAWDKIRQISTGVKKRPLATHDEILMLTKHAAKYHYEEPITETISPRRTGPFKRMQGMRHLQAGNGHRYSADVLRLSPERHQDHTAPLPLALVRWCAVRTCPPNGRMIDPFGGSGTVGMVAADLGVDATLIEINATFVALMERRINAAIVRNHAMPDLEVAE